ncbi:ELWxxDGT repeat protein [Adhaeribacter soli]|uniref:T9SS type A sorting domain-containing protein n=1 Tax=Adhaeribacter soli TaxID=2607655 RepID=A0A5N1J1T2_9BACT|nr:ELWxxDGT repeat protein [Adhaeribacter soli]KAA9340027.1 T9SS type A sorting domain-containing protein [Adhaeribacter soli]
MKKLLLGLMTCIVFPAMAQMPVLVKDINTTSFFSDSDPGSFIEYNGKTYFSADDGINGEELWVTDGTTAGTMMVKDVNPGASHALVVPIIVFNGKLYFSASTSAGRELWYTDGTAAGTQMLADIKPGNGSSSMHSFFIAGNKLYFRADNGVNGDEYWVTDGTSAGTKMIKDINPGAGGQEASVKGIAYQNKFYFYGYDATLKRQLWVTDGTTAGTIMLTPPTANNNNTLIDYDMIVFNNKLYFTFHTSAPFQTDDVELWVTDGTVAGTQLFKDLAPGSSSGWPSHFHIFNNKLLFLSLTYTSTYRVLMSSDGIAAGTVVITPLDVLGAKENWTPWNGKLYFEGSATQGNRELYVTDGTAAGTYMIKDINPGSSTSGIENITVAGNKLFFSAITATNGVELWVSDGTGPGTQLVKDINPGTNGAIVQNLNYFNNKLYFTARQSQTDFQLFETDGTTAGTRIVSPANATVTMSPLAPTSFGGRPGVMKVANNNLYFSANYTNAGFELYKIGGTVSSTGKPVNDQAITIYPNPVTEKLHLNLPESSTTKHLTATIINATGQTVLKSNLSEKAIDVQLLAPGIYYLVVTDNQRGTAYQKTFVKQ